jgi:GDPmannose 4,6-dehydratase
MKKRKKAFITGITGQDGSYLAELLLMKGYEVHGLIRQSTLEIKRNIEHLYTDPHVPDRMFNVHYGDMTDSTNLVRLMSEIQPDEVYNLAAQSHVRISFDIPEYTSTVDALGTLRMLESLRIAGLLSSVRVYQASTSELFGKVTEVPQSETTPFYPRSPYGIAKLYAYWTVINYREAYNMHASNGILFNHESPRRANSFVTKKIVVAAVKIRTGKLGCLYLGNLEAKRDWGYAPDYVEAMWRILQRVCPDDYIIATGETHTVREFVELTFKRFDIGIAWEGCDINEVGRDISSGKIIIRIDPYYFRPTEVDILLGNYTKAKTILGWSPSIKFTDLVNLMADWEKEHQNS